jgi:hypothetical protein
MMVMLNGMVAEPDEVDANQTDESSGESTPYLDCMLPPLDGAADLSDDEPEEEMEEAAEVENDAGQADEVDEFDTSPPAIQSPRLSTLLLEIADAETLCANAEEAVSEAKAVLKEARAEYDGCVMRLRRLAKALRNDQDRPLLDGLDGGEQANADSQDDVDEQYDALLKNPIDVLKLPAGIVAKLAEAGVETVGDLETLREDIVFDRKSWPKGIGPAKVDMIEDAVIEWLAQNDHDVVPSDVDGEDDNDETEVNDDGEEDDE